MTSCTLDEQSIAKPVCRQAYTSEWSPKMDSAWLASARAETWITQGSSSPAILYIFGIMSSRPWEAVYVVVRAPAAREPCTTPAAPPSDCISMTWTSCPNKFFLPDAAHLSVTSAMTEDGVMG